MSLESALNFSGRLSVSVAAPPLFSLRTKSLIARLLLSIPPPAAERLKQRRRVGVSIRPGLNRRQRRRVVGLLRVEYGNQADRSQSALLLCEIKAFFRGPFRFCTRLERVGIRVERAQRVGHILACQDDGGAVLRGRLVQS